MGVLLSGLGKWTFREAHQRISQFGNTAGVSEPDLLELLDRLPAMIRQYPDSFTIENISWRNYENLIWTLGEAIRRILKSDRQLRRCGALWTRVETICLEQRYGKGRESFTMLLGKYGGRDRAAVLLRLLEDVETQGHAIYALRLLGLPGAEHCAEELLHSQRAWIRRESRKYLDKVRAPSVTHRL